MSLEWDDDGNPEVDDGAWRDDAIAAWQQNYAPDGVAAQVVEELGGNEERTDAIDENLMAMYFESRGIDPETASPDDWLDAAQSADDWHDRVEQQLGVQHAQQLDRASNADEVALVNALDQFTEAHGSTEEEATPYIELAFQAMENGVSFEDAMRQAGDALDRWRGEVNDAERESHFGSLGYDEGVKSALSNFMRAQGVPRYRGGDAPKAIPSSAAHRLGNPDASKTEISNAVSAFAARQRAKAAVRDGAQRHVRGR